MLENRAFLIKKKVIASLIIICILSYSFMGLMNVSDAASTYTQSIKSGIDAFPESYKTYLRQIQPLKKNRNQSLRRMIKATSRH